MTRRWLIFAKNKSSDAEQNQIQRQTNHSIRTVLVTANLEPTYIFQSDNWEKMKEKVFGVSLKTNFRLGAYDWLHQIKQYWAKFKDLRILTALTFPKGSSAIANWKNTKAKRVAKDAALKRVKILEGKAGRRFIKQAFGPLLQLRWAYSTNPLRNTATDMAHNICTINVPIFFNTTLTLTVFWHVSLETVTLLSVAFSLCSWNKYNHKCSI